MKRIFVTCSKDQRNTEFYASAKGHMRSQLNVLSYTGCGKSNAIFVFLKYEFIYF